MRGAPDTREHGPRRALQGWTSKFHAELAGDGTSDGGGNVVVHAMVVVAETARGLLQSVPGGTGAVLARRHEAFRVGSETCRGIGPRPKQFYPPTAWTRTSGVRALSKSHTEITVRLRNQDLTI